MEEDVPKVFPFIFIEPTLGADRCAEVIEYALAHRRQADPAPARQLEQVLRRRAPRIDGFRDPLRAPLSFLMKALRNLPGFPDELLNPAVRVWATAQPDLREDVVQFLTAKGIHVLRDEDLEQGFLSYWKMAEMEREAETFVQEKPKWRKDDVALMLCYLAGRAPFPDHLRDNENAPGDGDDSAWEGEGGVNWDRWLELLRELPADAPEWAGAEAFLEGVQQIAAEKQNENNRRDQLRGALETLISRCRDEINYFRMVEVPEWSGHRCPLSDTVSLVAQVAEFQGFLTEHREIRQETGGSFQEDRRRRERLGDLEERIFEVYRTIGVVLGSPSPDTPDPELQGDAQGTEPDDDEPVGPPDPQPISGDAAVIQETPEKLEGRGEDPERPGREPEAPTITPDSLPATEAVDLVAKGSETSQPLIPLLPQTTFAAGLGRPEATAPESGAAPQPSVVQRTAKEIATHLKTEDGAAEWHALLWALVRKQDLPGAYWLSRSLAATGRTAPVPAWLIAAAQGARWVKADTDPLVADLLDIVSGHQPDHSEEQQLLGLASALHASLIAPGTGLAGWLEAPSGYPALHKLVNAVREFVGTGKALYAEDIHGVAGAARYDTEISGIAREAENWLEGANDKTTRMPRATRVWQHLVRPQGEIHELLFPVSRDTRNAISRVRVRLASCQDRNHMIERIHDIDGGRNRIRSQDITGDPLGQIIRWVREATDIASRWCERVERQHDISRGNDWWYTQVNTLRTHVQVVLGDLSKELGSSHDPEGIPPAPAAVNCLRATISQICETLSIANEAREGEKSHQEAWDWLVEGKDRLVDALTQRLLWLPEVRLGSIEGPVEADLPGIGAALRDACADERTADVVTDAWIDRQDYRFVEQLLGLLQGQERSLELSRKYQDAMGGSRAALREEIFKTTATIEQAVVDGIIGEERSAFSANVSAIRPEEAVDFPPMYEILKAVRGKLAEKRRHRLESLRNDWETLQSQVRSAGSPPRWEEAQALVKSALETGNTRVVEEYLADLRGAIEEGRELPDDWFSVTTSRDVLKEFNERATKIVDWLEQEKSLQQVAKSIQHGSTNGDIAFGTVPKPRRDEAAGAIEAWRRLKQGGAKSPDCRRHIQSILRYLGFIFARETDLPIRTKQEEADWLYVQAVMAASDLAKPIHQFGSSMDGRYNIVCLWERPGVDTMSAWIRQMRLDSHNVIVFYLGRLTARQRQELTSRLRDRELAVALLDETMLVFLAGEHDVRLPSLLRCALPAASVNPYTPFRAGDVPPEMFYGREEMVRELQRNSGSCLVYGGRQLGKSALLRHVQREFHDPKQGQYAWVVDIKMLGESQPTDAVWGKLRDGFREIGLFPAQVTTDKPDVVARHIEKAVKEAECRVIVLFDEADKFLDADARSSFRVVEGLRTLMVHTERRIKVIFAGLHSVQRFQGIPNQPLAHFGMPLCVGPLDPRDAQRLVREPLEVLGFRFPDNSTVLRVLSYTNYHPGLIQLFCHELLKRLYARTVGRLAPYDVTSDEVEDVYLAPEIGKRIRELLDFTIALDTRYQAIVWAMICDQMSAHDSYARAYSPAAILEMVRVFWRQGFYDAGTEQIRSLLDEMCGLGVMVRNREGHYRLRSPNLVRLLGTEEDIRSRLLELDTKEPEREFNADTHHAPLDDNANRYSPLTYSQERILSNHKFGVGMVFASPAMGFGQLIETFRHFIPADLPDEVSGDCTAVPEDVQSGPQLKAWLDQYLKENANLERMVVHKTVAETGEQCAAQIEVALELCRRRERSQRQWMRVMFLFDARATWEWAQLPESKREELENQSDSLAFARRWNAGGVRQRLEQHNKMNTDEVCDCVMVATGGWPLLLDELFDRCDSQVDPRPCAQEIEQELSDPESVLAKSFRRGIGLAEDMPSYRVLRFLQREGRVPVDMIVPEIVGGEPALAAECCAAAVVYLVRMGYVDVHSEEVSAEKIVARLF